LTAKRFTKDTIRSNKESTADDISAILPLIIPTISLVIARIAAVIDAKEMAFFSGVISGGRKSKICVCIGDWRVISRIKLISK
jgi:hypothetical protein